jgi:mannose-6-phosphate isomerase-like protein (cupin superfamily)
MAERARIEEIEEQAALFALGALTPEDGARFEQRIAAGCSLCRAELRECEETVAALPLSAGEVAPPPALRARLLASVGASDRPAVKSAMGEGTIVRSNDTPWVPTPIPGVQTRPLFGKKTMLVRMAPRTWLPAHDHHQGAEQCLVLEGSVSSDGVTAYAGDFTYMPLGSSHHPLYSEDGCLLLIAYT